MQEKKVRAEMQAFGKEFYRALAIGFLIGCVGMALSADGSTGHARANPSHVVAGGQ